MPAILQRPAARGFNTDLSPVGEQRKPLPADLDRPAMTARVLRSRCSREPGLSTKPFIRCMRLNAKPFRKLRVAQEGNDLCRHAGWIVGLDQHP